jgi:hypothetical protein
MCEDPMARTTHHRARLVKAIRHRTDDHEAIDTARTDQRAAVADQTIHKIADLLHRTAQATPRVASRKTPTEVDTGSGLRGRGQVFGFVLALIAFGNAIVLAGLGMPNVGAMFLSPPVLALIFAFVVG